MDPQKLSQLDPKLREAYQRVMGTQVPQPQVIPVQAQTPTPPPVPTPGPTPVPQPQPEPEPTPISTPTIEEPPTAPEPPVAPPVSEPQPAIPQPANPTSPPAAVQSNNFMQMNSEVAAAPTPDGGLNFATPVQTQIIATKKKSNLLMPVMIGIASLVFIAVYTLFWTRIFNFKFPFLP